MCMHLLFHRLTHTHTHSHLLRNQSQFRTEERDENEKQTHFKGEKQEKIKQITKSNKTHNTTTTRKK